MTLLSVVLALVLTAALAACSSDEPSGGTTSTATDAAATAPPAASGSAETDWEALVALHNATDGENWITNYNWLSDAPLGEWEGVTTNRDGRVPGLDLGGYGLSGEIPPELGSLSNLGGLRLSDNELSGEIQAELGSLSYLIGLSLGDGLLHVQGFHAVLEESCLDVAADSLGDT